MISPYTTFDYSSILLDTEHNGLELVKKAAVTAVITGTAAWEAMCLHKPVLIIGDSPFFAVGEGFVHEPCLSRLPQAIARTLKTSPALDETIELFIAASLAESFEMPSSLLWGAYDEHSDEEKKSATSAIVEGIISNTEKPGTSRT